MFSSLLVFNIFIILRKFTDEIWENLVLIHLNINLIGDYNRYIPGCILCSTHLSVNIEFNLHCHSRGGHRPINDNKINCNILLFCAKYRRNRLQASLNRTIKSLCRRNDARLFSGNGTSDEIERQWKIFDTIIETHKKKFL